MSSTDLFLRIPSAKALPISQYDEEFEVAKISKINESINLSEKQRKTCSALVQSLEFFGYEKLRNYLIVSVIKLINSTFSICSSNHNKTDFCTLICISTD